MAKKPKAVRPEEKTQIERFKEAARQIGADETGEAFERAFEKIARSPPIKSNAAPKGRLARKPKQP